VQQPERADSGLETQGWHSRSVQQALVCCIGNCSRSSSEIHFGECRGGRAPATGGLGVSPRFILFPLSLGKGEGDTGGESFRTASSSLAMTGYFPVFCETIGELSLTVAR
jgi:hypothetical protein